jgi:hypothetical protein
MPTAVMDWIAMSLEARNLAYRSQGHVPGDLVPIANTNHFTILDELRQPNSTLTRAVIAMAQYQTA